MHRSPRCASDLSNRTTQPLVWLRESRFLDCRTLDNLLNSKCLATAANRSLTPANNLMSCFFLIDENYVYVCRCKRTYHALEKCITPSGKMLINTPRHIEILCVSVGPDSDAKSHHRRPLFVPERVVNCAVDCVLRECRHFCLIAESAGERLEKCSRQSQI